MYSFDEKAHVFTLRGEMKHTHTLKHTKFIIRTFQMFLTSSVWVQLKLFHQREAAQNSCTSLFYFYAYVYVCSLLFSLYFILFKSHAKFPSIFTFHPVQVLARACVCVTLFKLVSNKNRNICNINLTICIWSNGIDDEQRYYSYCK